jgi:hypothetical protein
MNEYTFAFVYFGKEVLRRDIQADSYVEADKKAEEIANQLECSYELISQKVKLK